MENDKVNSSKITEHFVIPEPYRAWCHHCRQRFLSIEALIEHNAEKLRMHQQQAEAAKQ